MSHYEIFLCNVYYNPFVLSVIKKVHMKLNPYADLICPLTGEVILEGI